jgi:hypothetical protein
MSFRCDRNPACVAIMGRFPHRESERTLGLTQRNGMQLCREPRDRGSLAGPPFAHSPAIRGLYPAAGWIMWNAMPRTEAKPTDLRKTIGIAMVSAELSGSCPSDRGFAGLLHASVRSRDDALCAVLILRRHQDSDDFYPQAISCSAHNKKSPAVARRGFGTLDLDQTIRAGSPCERGT